MLTFFFAIVFIAEVIIALHIISFIIKCDKLVCELNDKVSKAKSGIPSIFTPVREVISNAYNNIEKIKIKLQEKKNKYKYAIIKNLITGLLFLTLNMKGKKIITFVELLFSLKDFSNLALKSLNSLKN